MAFPTVDLHWILSVLYSCVISHTCVVAMMYYMRLNCRMSIKVRSNAVHNVARVLYYVRIHSAPEQVHWIRIVPKVVHHSKPPRLTLYFSRSAEGFLYFCFMYSSKEKIGDVVSLVLSYYRDHGRLFPWRETSDPYHILVSECMLQQTQTDRVIPKYNSFIKKFPNIWFLASADRRDALAVWNGLGYNRRAVALHDAAKMITEVNGGIVPRAKEDLLTLPGIGDYTAGAVLAFAYNDPVVVVETNIRTVVFHHCVRKKKEIEDNVVYFFIEKMLLHAVDLGVSPRVFYSAMMDYGSHLKSVGVRVNRRSRHYVKQKKFNGSVRQARGTLLRFFLTTKKGVSDDRLKFFGTQRIKEGLSGLISDGLIEKRGKYYYLAETDNFTK